MQTRSASQLRDEYISRSSHDLQIIEGLENNPSFQMLIEDQKKNIEQIDVLWHTISDIQKFNELRISKMASLAFVNVLQSYRNDMIQCQRAIKEIEDGFDGTNEEDNGE